MKKTHGIRGSSKHILDWLGIGKSEFISSLNKLLLPSGATVSEADTWMPVGKGDPEAMKEARLDQNTLNVLTPDQQKEVANWWLAYTKGGLANTPNWDFASSCSIEGVKGLVLVEAKAHPKELSHDGKFLKAKPSPESKENDDKLGKAIDEARTALQKDFPEVKISKDTHYQLSNRIAFSWKLASMGIPVVLIYLGFLKDDGLKDIDTPFSSDESLRSIMESYFGGIVPKNFLERRINCGKASMQVLIRSMECIQVSPSQAEVLKILKAAV